MYMEDDMCRFKLSQILMTSLILLTFTISINAEVPQLINYQGRLTDTGGNPVEDAEYLLTFTIYDGSESIIWREIHTNVNTSNGLFNVLLGAGDNTGYGPLTGSHFEGSERWLGIQVNGDLEIVPRTRLTSVPFSYHSLNADDADMVDGVDASDLEESAEIISAIDQFSEDLSQMQFDNLFHYYYGGFLGPGTYVLFTAPADKAIYITGIIGFADGSDIAHIKFGVDGYTVLNVPVGNSSDRLISWTSCWGAPIKMEPNQSISMTISGAGYITITGYQF